jgi:tight adherence protein C
MSAVALFAALAVGAGCAGLGAVLVPPTRRLGPRVRPYTLVARASLGHPPDAPEHAATRSYAGVWGRLFGPPMHAALVRVGSTGGRRNEHLARLLYQSGSESTDIEAFRLRQIGSGVALAAAGGMAVAILTRSPSAVLVTVIAGYVVGATRPRKQLERALTERAARMRHELYTVNHLLALHVRTGSGPIQAVQRIVDRGRGVVVDELATLVTAIRHGVPEVDAFRQAAESTPEPSAARTYQLLAASAERGADLGPALLALSEDVRDARREQLHKDAVRRRAAMLVPTIAILAPIMLLFIAAPLPSIVLGNR